ncbi:hypothetical protein ABIE26_002264 [Pedobacter africanus]|uniref:Uncharacterized protein n=1 Tax=Pedobacter africanus TaxID=151894 RepID=A0ACC6KYK2_9SPHI|nr:hypothetical protein [Pedobacter africanus]MDR6784347.1 hypothetical protein [Pedobacter africanus]
MKTNSIILLFLSALFLFSGCKKDRETDNSQITTARLQGKWEATKFTEKIYEVQGNKLVSEKTTAYPANERSIEYKGSEILYYRNQTLRNTYTYAVIGNEMRIREGNQGFYFQFKFYSDTQHSHIEEDYYKNNTIEMKEVTETYYNKN